MKLNNNSERGRVKFNRYKFFILLLIKFFSLFSRNCLSFFLIYHRTTKGNIGLVIRYALLKNLALSIGDNVSIHPDVYLLNIKNLKIGNNVSIHPMSYIEASGGITIGNDVSIAHSTTIMSTSHKYMNLKINIKDQEVISNEVIICNNVWIGAKATILSGNKISSGSIIGAGAVVTKNIDENSIAVGVPAKVIKTREDI
jgi:acetyltransferase-like isoleucine patch superfamily enzyme